MWLGFLTAGPWSHFKISFEIIGPKGVISPKCGAYLLYKEGDVSEDARRWVSIPSKEEDEIEKHCGACSGIQH